MSDEKDKDSPKSLWDMKVSDNEPQEPLKIKKMTPEEMKKSIAKVSKDIQKRLHPGREKPKARIGQCIVCGGTVSEDFKLKYDPRSGPLIIGSGSRDQHYWASTGLSCDMCGLLYKKLPEAYATRLKD